MSKTKKINKFLERVKNEELLDLKNFYLSLHRHLSNSKNNYFIIEIAKNKDEYELSNVVLAKGLKEFIPKNDEIWKNFKYKNLNEEQVFEKYYELFKNFKGKKFVKDGYNYVNRSKFYYYNKKMKKLKELKTNQNEIETEAPNKLYCFCQKPYMEGDKMMGLFIL